MRRTFSFLFILLLAGVIFNSLPFATAEDLTRTHSGGNVEVTVSLISPEDLTRPEVDELILKVYLNTHSVDLLAYEMNKISFLRDERGNEYSAISWQSLGESSHHRSGILKFSNLDENGDFIITSKSEFMELVIKGLAGIEKRSFRWDVLDELCEIESISGEKAETNQRKEMSTIRWLGHASFLISSPEGMRIITDPYSRSVGYKVPLPEADIVLVSHDHFDHNATEEVEGSPRIIRGSGEHKVDGLTFLGIPSFHDKVSGRKRGKNTIFVWEMNGIKFAHLGDLGHLLNKEELPYLKGVDVLFIPVGGYFTIDYQEASQIVERINSRIVIPMHYKTEALGSGFPIDGVEKFLIDKENIEQMNSSQLKITEDVLKEKTRIIILQFRK